jgi:hypothetical protein
MLGRRGSAAGLFVGLTVAVVAAAVAGCDSGGPPDTGVGAHQTPPAAVTCADLCRRTTDCFAELCNEDTGSTRYTALGDVLDRQCVATCTDSVLQSKITADQWRCTFESSCRQILENDVCQVTSRYSCS